MGVIVYKDGNIELDKQIHEIQEHKDSVVLYLSQEFNHSFYKNLPKININNDIDIINKNSMFIKIPYLKNGSRHKIEATLEGNTLILLMSDMKFIDFLKEKLTLNRDLSGKLILLDLFQYLALSYNEKLIKIEESIDSLFDEAMSRDKIQMESLLKRKKQTSLIKRYTNYYKAMLIYLADEFNEIPLYDKLFFIFANTIELVEDVESSIYSCIDIYNSMYSNKMNKTMQLLTFITVLTIPATLITGIFGMNFSSMPLISNQYGFFISFALMALIVGIEIYIFKKNKLL